MTFAANHLPQPRPLPGRWALDAACRGLDPELFHPHSGERDKINAAKQVCAQCPVVDQCRTYGLGERQGIWGGLTERERRHERIRRRLDVA